MPLLRNVQECAKAKIRAFFTPIWFGAVQSGYGSFEQV